MAEKLAYNCKEAAAALGVSLPVLYTLSKREDFPCIRVGRRTLIPVDGLRAWLVRETQHA